MPVRFVIRAPDTDAALDIIASHFVQLASELHHIKPASEIEDALLSAKAQTWLSAAHFLRQVHVERSGQTSASVEIVP